MLKRVAVSVISLACSTVAFLVVTDSPASASPCMGRGGSCSSGDTASAQSNGQTVTVRVSGSFVHGGSGGSGGSTTVSVPSPCWYTEGMSGAEYYQWVKSGEADFQSHHTDGENYQPTPGYRTHKDDNDGHWYSPMCDSSVYEDRFGSDPGLKGFMTYVDAWFKTHDTVYVPAGATPPVAEIPPQVLAYAAEKAMGVPNPAFAFNPDRPRGEQTVVNIPTWFWLTDPRTQGSVTASAGGHSATVTARLTDFTVTSGDGDTTGNCGGPGTAWTKGMGAAATSDCAITFMQPTTGTRLTATTSWGVSWTYDGAAQGQLDPITATWASQISVGQVEAINTDG